MQRSVPPFSDLLADCQLSAVHLEMRDAYGVANEDEDYAAWRAGHRYDLANRASWWNDFHDSIAAAVARGVVVRRARVVSEPVSEYIRYEHSCTPQNLAAGEDVRWLPRRLALDLMLPGADLWIFDGWLIRFGLFSGDGAFVGHILEEDPSLARVLSCSFEDVWARAIPHADYQI